MESWNDYKCIPTRDAESISKKKRERERGTRSGAQKQFIGYGHEKQGAWGCLRKASEQQRQRRQNDNDTTTYVRSRCDDDDDDAWLCYMHSIHSILLCSDVHFCFLMQASRSPLHLLVARSFLSIFSLT